jgi:hypothetical protein
MHDTSRCYSPLWLFLPTSNNLSQLPLPWFSALPMLCSTLVPSRVVLYVSWLYDAWTFSYQSGKKLQRLALPQPCLSVTFPSWVVLCCRYAAPHPPTLHGYHLPSSNPSTGYPWYPHSTGYGIVTLQLGEMLPSFFSKGWHRKGLAVKATISNKQIGPATESGPVVTVELLNQADGF